MSVRTRKLTATEVLALPAMPDLVPDGAAALGISRDLAYDLARADDFPIRVIRIGRVLKIRRVDLLEFLGIEDENGDAGAGTPASVERTTAPSSN